MSTDRARSFRWSVSSFTLATAGADPQTVVVCPEINNHKNLGTLIRICAGFGVDAMLLGERCTDPFWRRSVRVSKGTVFHLPICCSKDLRSDLEQLRRGLHFQLVATVTEGGEPLADARRPQRLALLFGSEAQGLNLKQASVERRLNLMSVEFDARRTIE